MTKPRLSALRTTVALTTVGLLAAVGAAPGTARQAPLAASTLRMSVSSSEGQANAVSGAPSVSAGGRYVAFTSRATNLVPGDDNDMNDVFVRDRKKGVTRRASLNSSELEGNGESYEPSISADGRFVTFFSFASNLVPDDDNDTYDVFVRDRKKGVTRLVSVSSGGQQANEASYDASISADGRYIAYYSAATNLVPHDTNGQNDVFVWDRVNGTTRRVSVGSNGQEAKGFSIVPDISADGSSVVFVSNAKNLVPGDGNASFDVFVRDWKEGVTRRVSVRSNEAEANGSSNFATVSANGRYVAFVSVAANLAPGDANGISEVYVRDRVKGVTRRVSVTSDEVPADVGSDGAEISGNGRFVAFRTHAPLAPGDSNGSSDVFVRDWRKGVTRRASVRPGNPSAPGYSDAASISADGRLVAFASTGKYVPGDTNDAADVFLRVM